MAEYASRTYRLGTASSEDAPRPFVKYDDLQVDELRALRDWHMSRVAEAAKAEREHRFRAQSLDGALMARERQAAGTAKE